MVIKGSRGRDFSSQNALEYYQQVCGSPAKSEIIFQHWCQSTTGMVEAL